MEQELVGLLSAPGDLEIQLNGRVPVKVGFEAVSTVYSLLIALPWTWLSLLLFSMSSLLIE